MTKDILFLLKADFEDAAYPGTRFVCPYCTFFEGLLSVFPEQESQIEVQRIGFERPREALIPYVGTDHQSCPALVLGTGSDVTQATGRNGDVAFIKGQKEIADYLSLTYGIAAVHP